jgi:hypothetical protein
MWEVPPPPITCLEEASSNELALAEKELQ